MKEMIDVYAYYDQANKIQNSIAEKEAKSKERTNSS